MECAWDSPATCSLGNGGLPTPILTQVGTTMIVLWLWRQQSIHLSPRSSPIVCITQLSLTRPAPSATPSNFAHDEKTQILIKVYPSVLLAQIKTSSSPCSELSGVSANHFCKLKNRLFLYKHHLYLQDILLNTVSPGPCFPLKITRSENCWASHLSGLWDFSKGRKGAGSSPGHCRKAVRSVRHVLPVP